MSTLIRSSLSPLLLVLATLFATGCDRPNTPDKALVGTWADQDREYVFREDGTFSMRLDTRRCTEAGASEPSTTSGTWSSERSRLTLRVKTSSDNALQGSTMNESIQSNEATTLVLESSVIACSGNIVRLTKR